MSSIGLTRILQANLWPWLSYGKSPNPVLEHLSLHMRKISPEPPQMKDDAPFDPQDARVLDFKSFVMRAIFFAF